MLTRRVLQTRLFAAFMAVFAACGAALAAHVAIDLAGDVLLAHDTYDGLAHQSRSEMFAGGLIALLAVVLGLVSRVVSDAYGTGARRRARFDEVFGRTPWRFGIAVALLALPALMLMEYADVAAARGTVDDLADLLGGSATLGASLTLAAAAVCAGAVRRIARFIFASHDVLVAAVGRLIVLSIRPAAPAAALRIAPRYRPSSRHRSLVARRAAKRGPPLPAR